MITGLVLGAVIVLALGLVVIVARDPGPPPADVALAYEAAWDHFDFESLWSLAGDELRDGLNRSDFVATKREAYAPRPELGALARDISVEDARDGDAYAVVRTRVDLRDGGVARNEIQLAKRAGRWVVVAYQLQPDVPPATP